ncbi:hypothetical protein ASF46_00585 [Rathayibacter sp. Leaf296]|nr:hypothetical protein ASF46_00585 [Rathayibacter sp. Leaf296]
MDGTLEECAVLCPEAPKLAGVRSAPHSSSMPGADPARRGFPTPSRRAPDCDAFFDSPQKRRSSWDEPTRAQLLLDWFRQRA